MKFVIQMIARASMLTGLFLAGSWVMLAQQEPAPAADNSRMNRQEDNKSGATAQSQKENSSDREMTRHIRRAIVQDKALSTYGHNVKIISRNGMVTLKGPVRSDEDKQAIEAKAKRIAGEDKVDDQLEVQPKQ
ncbi:MAG TPA: BON domain-containing protein [Terriglobia bacterium]|nr:BON domain-containing protein [Terriglobia bacterium]